MSEFSYLTVTGETTGLYKEKGSKFLAFVYPVTSEAEIKAYQEGLRKKYFDARHHCFAWVLGADKSRYRASDDGEPNHSAGDPILGQIRSRNLTNVLVVVVRYFGGVKLGVGGLIVAYRTAAQNALDTAIVIEREITETLTIRYDYANTPEVMRLVKDFELVIISQDFQSSCELRLEIKLKVKDAFIEKTQLLIATGTPLSIEMSHPQHLPK